MYSTTWKIAAASTNCEYYVRRIVIFIFGMARTFLFPPKNYWIGNESNRSAREPFGFTSVFYRRVKYNNLLQRQCTNYIQIHRAYTKKTAIVNEASSAQDIKKYQQKTSRAHLDNGGAHEKERQLKGKRSQNIFHCRKLTISSIANGISPVNVLAATIAFTHIHTFSWCAIFFRKRKMPSKCRKTHNFFSLVHFSSFDEAPTNDEEKKRGINVREYTTPCTRRPIRFKWHFAYVCAFCVFVCVWRHNKNVLQTHVYVNWRKKLKGRAISALASLNVCLDGFVQV